MRVRDVRNIARQWVLKEADTLPGFQGAFLTGSITTAPDDDAIFPASSDVDVKIVLDAPPDTGGPQKVVVSGAILDVSFAPSEEFRSPEMVLGTYYTAVHFVRPGILLDPSGHLSAIQRIVAQEYPRRVWVRKRAEHACAAVEDVLTWLNPATPMQDQVFKLLLPTALATHVVLVADLRNPTIRTCLVAIKKTLAAYGKAPVHEALLGVLGSASMSREQVNLLQGSCVDAFDVASTIRATPFPYASNIAPYARPTAIEGSREMIDSGYHREAMFWVAAIHSWCQRVIDYDASDEVRSRLAPSYGRLLVELGVPTHEDLAGRIEHLRQLLPGLWNAAEEIIATNPAIID